MRHEPLSPHFKDGEHKTSKEKLGQITESAFEHQIVCFSLVFIIPFPSFLLHVLQTSVEPAPHESGAQSCLAALHLLILALLAVSALILRV